jgi:hypothetical protein
MNFVGNILVDFDYEVCFILPRTEKILERTARQHGIPVVESYKQVCYCRTGGPHGKLGGDNHYGFFTIDENDRFVKVLFNARN